MQKLNAENLILLLTLLNESDENDLLMKAEVLRNLGRFDESRQLLDKVKNADLIEVKEKFLAEINKQNKSRSFSYFDQVIPQPIFVVISIESNAADEII